MKTQRIANNRESAMAPTENQVFENTAVTGIYNRLFKGKEKRWENEGITENVYENK